MKINCTKIIARFRAGIFKSVLVAALAGALVSCCNIKPTTILYFQIPNQPNDDNTVGGTDSSQPSVIVIGLSTNFLSAANPPGQVSVPGANLIRIYVANGNPAQNKNATDKSSTKQKFSARNQSQPK